MLYCKNCVLPDTRPGIVIESDGVCNACHGHRDKKDNIDWEKRKKAFEEITDKVKSLKCIYDCIVPVSGGKDSTYQVVKCLEYDLKPLAVTWKTPGRTHMGQKNLDNLISLGVDHIDITVNPEVERKFFYKALVRVGSIGVPVHMAIYHIPFRLAVDFKIPLILWGESPVMEYGGAREDFDLSSLDYNFLKKHDILHKTSLGDWAGDDLSMKDLEIYTLPDEEEVKKRDIGSIFVGYYFNWSPQETYRVAKKHGFSLRNKGPKMGYYDYADIDCDFMSVHHYFKWLKFGFTRLFDNLALEIRNGYISRAEALGIIRKTGEWTPYEDIEKLCSFLKISGEHFWEIAERFRNKEIWSEENGTWLIKDFIIKDWKWE